MYYVSASYNVGVMRLQVAINAYYAPPLIGGCIKRWCCLTSVCLSGICLSRTSGLCREQRGQIGIEVAHVTCDSVTTFKVKKSKVKVTRPVYSSRRLRTGSCSGQRGNVLSVGNCCYVDVCRHGGRLSGARRYGAHRWREGAGAYRVATRTACYTAC